MAEPWRDIRDASFRGIAFACERITDEGGHALGVHEYPDKEGAAIEDGGRHPGRWSIDALFFGEDYLADLEAFQAALNERGVGELVHPFFAEAKQVAVETWSSPHEPDVDFGRCSFTVVEHTVEETHFVWGPEIASAPAMEAALLSTLEELDETRQSILGTASTSRSALETYRTWVRTARTAVETTEAQVEAQLRTAIAAVNSELAALEAIPASVAPVLDLLHQAAFQATELANLALAGQSRIIEYTVPAAMSVWELARNRFGSVARAQDILRLNELAHPALIAPGTVVRLHAV